MQVNSLLKIFPASLVLALSIGLTAAPGLAQNANGGTGSAAGTSTQPQNAPNSGAQINAAQSQAQQSTQSQINKAAQTNRQAIQQSQARNQNQINAAQARNAAQVNQTQARGTASNNVQTNPPQTNNKTSNASARTSANTNSSSTNTANTTANNTTNNTASNTAQTPSNRSNLTPTQANQIKTTTNGGNNTAGNLTRQNPGDSSSATTELTPNAQPQNTTSSSQNTANLSAQEPGPILDTQAQILEYEQEVFDNRELVSSKFPKSSRPGVKQGTPPDGELKSETSTRFKDDANDADDVQQADFLFLWSIALFLMASTLGVAYMVYRKRQGIV